MDIFQITLKTIQIAKHAAEFIRSNINANGYEINNKGLNDFVTEIDKKTELYIVQQLQLLIPEAGFIAEEKSSTKIGEVYNWIVDPIDGTTNFIHGLFPCSVSIGLKCNSQIILGVIYEVGHDECFYAYKGGGAWLNGNRIYVSTTNSIKNSFLATGFPYNNFEKINQYIDLLKYFVTNAQGIRRLGSAAVDMAYVACGRFDGFYEIDLKPYDVSAGIIIVEEAGGCVADFSGEDNCLFGGEMVAGNKIVFEEFVSIIKKIMKGSK